ncbi:MAG: primosomal protein N' [Planctomycetes bacterium]|nr:primosomal protein N' [Planctomycetota bacterium]MCB9917710.1 primosomal protein N' [Planctomycetota bacterium]
MDGVRRDLFSGPSNSEHEAAKRDSSSDSNRLFARVALPIPVTQEYTYVVPARLETEITVGCRVRVPFHGRRMTGVVVALDEVCDFDPKRLRAIEVRLAETPALPPKVLEFTRSMAEHYCCSWGTALDAAWPASLKSRPAKTVPAVALVDRNLDAFASDDATDAAMTVLELEEASPKRARVLRAVHELGSPVPVRVLTKFCGVSKSPIATLVRQGYLRWTRVPEESTLLEESMLERAPRHDLTEAQAQAVDRITRTCETPAFDPFLLWGVTGSGKTEVYLRVLERVTQSGRGAIILVPEIALTPQTVGRFRSRFPEVAVLHSSLGDGERARQWLRIARSESNVVVGTRSAIFAPIRDVGLIVVDEEHETSFKQQSSPRYHAREMALVRGRLEKAIVVLGSATPSLESYHAARSGSIGMIRLDRRVGSARLPRVLTVDMRHEKPQRGRPPLLSQQLVNLIDERVRAREQVLLFLNRRGFAPVLYCSACGDTVMCEHCDVPMTWHSRRARLICHYCFEERRRPEVCPGCKSATPIALGSGTERIEDTVRQRWPELVVARMDSDTMTRKGSYDDVLTAFRRRDIDILIGTQMIAKGLDFPDVTLVGVVSADTGVYMPDFRAAERTFSVLSQVAGRAGRGAREGLVVVQTLSPALEPIARACALDTEGFLDAELESRRALGYPPFGRLVRVVIEGRELATTASVAHTVAEKLRHASDAFTILGPMEAPLARVRQRYRQHVVVKARNDAALQAARNALIKIEGSGDRATKVLVDVDPQSML